MNEINAYKEALDSAWHKDTAQSSLERWLQLTEQEGWDSTPEEIEALVGVFGASWYFTRFIYVNGNDAADLVAEQDISGFTTEGIYEHIAANMPHESLEARLEKLRFLKNRFMLKILLAYLSGKSSQEKVECALTCLAEATLRYMARIFRLSPELAKSPVSILGMGRMAGYEMTFGSDLDLIFLYKGDGGAIDPKIEREIRALLRNIPLSSPMGVLYDVDMRLRPHGNAGVLVTSHKSFLKYHNEQRDIWERQMMTRCRPVLNISDEVNALMNELNRSIYAKYDKNNLKNEILYMRKRVQKELGSPAGKYEVKRGQGGIMDIDFICHYLQLAYGHDLPELQVPSTRRALRLLHKTGYIEEDTHAELLECYDFLKRIEMSLRLFDMKTVSAFPVEARSDIALSRAMGFYKGDGEDFITAFRNVTGKVRANFRKLVGDPDV